MGYKLTYKWQVPVTKKMLADMIPYQGTATMPALYSLVHVVIVCVPYVTGRKAYFAIITDWTPKEHSQKLLRGEYRKGWEEYDHKEAQKIREWNAEDKAMLDSGEVPERWWAYNMWSVRQTLLPQPNQLKRFINEARSTESV